MDKRKLRFIGLNMQQRGDLVMNTVAARAIKEQFPNSYFTLGISKPLEDMLPLFLYNKYIDDIHIWESSDGLTENDMDYISFNGFDKVFDPMPHHKLEDWYYYVKNQTEEVCAMHDLRPPEDLSCYLNKWFALNSSLKDYVALVAFGGVYRGINNEKCLNENFANEIVKLIKEFGYKTLQISGPNEPKLKNALNLNTSYFESVVNMLSCKFVITVDTGLSWIASAYKFPTLGLYSNRYYEDRISVIQPINSNAIYLDDYSVNNISLNKIEKLISILLSRKLA